MQNTQGRNAYIQKACWGSENNCVENFLVLFIMVSSCYKMLLNGEIFPPTHWIGAQTNYNH